MEIVEREYKIIVRADKESQATAGVFISRTVNELGRLFKDSEHCYVGLYKKEIPTKEQS